MVNLLAPMAQTLSSVLVPREMAPQAAGLEVVGGLEAAAGLEAVAVVAARIVPASPALLSPSSELHALALSEEPLHSLPAHLTHLAPLVCSVGSMGLAPALPCVLLHVCMPPQMPPSL